MNKTTTLILTTLLASACFEDPPQEGGTSDTATTGSTGSTADSTGTNITTGAATSTSATDSGSTGGVNGSTGGGSSGSGTGTSTSTGSTGGSTGASTGIIPTVEDLQPCDVDAECLSGTCYLPDGLGGTPQGFCLGECFNGLDCPDPEPGTNVGCWPDFMQDTKVCIHGCPDPGFVNNCPEGWLCYDVGVPAGPQPGTCFPYP